MAATTGFSSDYREARLKFHDAATRAGAVLHRYRSGALGPAGEELATDTAWLGPAAAGRVLVTLSATHGVEGFCGSGIQVAALEAGIGRSLPPDTAVLMIHAINPYGFAWLRRVTEENVDLNRNFTDFAQALPRNPGYEALAEWICPREWSDAALAEADRHLAAYAAEHGEAALSRAVTGGQYSHADGIFFGGAAPTWARQTLERIVGEQLAGARRVATIDYHTGLGPRGYGEPIVVHAPESAAFARALQWYGDKVTSTALGSSTSPELNGVNVAGMERLLGHAEFTAIALEFGTLPVTEVRDAVRADNWLHLHGDPASAKGRALKRRIRDAFYGDDGEWKETVLEQGLERQAQALRGLAG